MINADAFHDHLDTCEQCRRKPFELCAIGEGLLTTRLRRGYYLARLREPALWLCQPNKWEQDKAHATRFVTFADAREASDGYDVVIETVEE